jgi:imidazoleglycerol-phosphate dehydratase / histidinol-phosphatase
MKKVLFIDRDGTLIEEPEDKQIDSLEKLQLLPLVIPSLLTLKQMGYRFVMISNQDGLGTDSYPEENFQLPQNKMLRLFESQGITFDDIKICPHFESDNCTCRKPHLGLVRDYLRDSEIDFEKSYVLGDRETDLAFAENMGIAGIRVGEEGLSWPDVVERIKATKRTGCVTRKTNETNISVEIDLDSNSSETISTGLGFFDHMLEQISKHGGFSMKVDAKGDLEVDEHHLIEDTALAIGEALRKALGDKIGINRFGFYLPMDETTAKVALDLSGRAFTVFKCDFKREKVGDIPTEMVEHFFRSLASSLAATINIEVNGENEHHMIESSFKAMGRALRMAISQSSMAGELPSTKGVL